ncbi:hypothetical protein S7711_01317 [Stachybotrys chartarum IBT 7711]|uniref:Ketoreductase domain-containing protein n=1 Tax=Stachybotrys chartarum (strain CBS 109288 / IBT 7711) TaxID=1280523 RepID=A0A084BBN9_STACB|nr:hypothetical protein S7711_01317 [Stachybotrys chartarum IBT 7711]KFA51856.1 hypothetical protein S40293_04075 [Stachybotrys chartarum IBT 40293]
MAQLVWLITGCSSGLGREFVRQIIARGDVAIATARKLDSIASLEEAGASIVCLDVTHEQDELDRIVAGAVAIHGRIDVLVNNAGFIVQGALEELSMAQIVAEFETNVFGAVKVTKALLPHFRQRRAGNLVFISSLSGWIGHPYVGAYAASKFAIEGFAESVRAETETLGIKTLLVEPGRFRTNLLTLGNLKLTSSKISDYEEAASANIEGLALEDRAQPGNPVKAISIVLDVIRGEGAAAGRAAPFRLPLGRDCYDEIKAKCDDMLDVLRSWEDVITSTDY